MANAAVGQQQSAETKALLAELERVKAENERLKAAKASRVSLKVSEKGAISLYGTGRWPVTLYKTGWEMVIQVVKSGTLEKFIQDNQDKLAVKES